MKTNQIMIRDEGFIQRTSDGYFNASNIVRLWNENNPNAQKQAAQYKQLKSTNEYIEQLEREGVSNPYRAGRGKGDNSGIWMHPYLFVDFAMWVSVEFKSKVIRYVVDGLILSRHEAGDFFNEMSAQILDSYVSVNGCKPNPTIYQREALMIREAVTDKKDRNEMTESELSAITALQKVNTILIKRGVGIDSRKKSILLFAESLKQ